jgi:RNA polymerase sigma-70 factor (ECF subfamily)
MSREQPDTETLLCRAGAGDLSAVGELLERQRARLRQMIAVRIDSRVATRVDPSDVVQETLAEAARKLPDYLKDRPLPFYPWLRRIAWERLVHLHIRHVEAQKRSVKREGHQGLALPDRSAMQLADRLAASGTTPSGNLIRTELRKRVRAALDRMEPHDREVIVLWHLEQLSVNEIAAVLAMTESGVKSRHRRAVERLAQVLNGEDWGA